MASSWQAFVTILHEQLSDRTVDMRLPEDDEFTWRILAMIPPERTGGRAEDSSGANIAGFQAKWNVLLQDPGLATGGNFTGNTVTAMGADSLQYMAMAADALYPDPANAALPSYAQIKMNLKRIRGVLTVDQQRLFADMTAVGTDKAIYDYVAGGAKLVRHLVSSHYWAPGNGALAQVDNDTSVISTGTNRKAIPVKNGRYSRFKVGQRYVFSADSSGITTQKSNSVARCVDIDEDNRKVIFEVEPGLSDITVADNDWIILEGMYDFTAAASLAPNSVESLLINTGVYPGTAYTISATNHRRLAARVKGSATKLELPTPEMLADMLNIFEESGRPGPSHIGAESGVWTCYSQIERQGGAVYPVAQGGQFQASGGVSARPVLNIGTKTYETFSSGLCRENCFFGLRPAAQKKFMPVNGETVMWVRGGENANGIPNIFQQLRSGRSLTEMHAAEFDAFCEFGDTEPFNQFRRLGVHSLNTAK